jgi:hypothetical protein
MKARILPPADWERVRGKGMDGMLPHMDPANAHVVVVEDEDGEIVAHVGVLRVTHLESLWLHPRMRGNVGAARRLAREAVRAAGPWLNQWAMAQVASPEIEDVVTRLGGVKIPVDCYAIALGGE